MTGDKEQRKTKVAKKENRDINENTVKRQKREKIYKQKSEKLIVETDRKIETEIMEIGQTQKMSRAQPRGV